MAGIWERSRCSPAAHCRKASPCHRSSCKPHSCAKRIKSQSSCKCTSLCFKIMDEFWCVSRLETVLCGLQTPPKGICAFGCSIALAESSRILTYMCCDEIFSCVFFNFLFVSCVRIYSSPKQEETHWHLLTSLLAIFLILFMNPSFITCERESILILST